MAIETILQNFGYLGIFGIIFLETGFLFGIFLPGDSLLFTAGILASSGTNMLIVPVIGAAFAAAILGYIIAYYTGKKFGPKIFNKPDSLLFKKSNIDKTHAYFEKFGKKTILFARLIPIVRTIAPVMAGVGQMDYKTYNLYNLLGGLLWTTLMPLIGYYFGKIIPNAEYYILPIVILIIVISAIPTIKHIYKTDEGKLYIKKFMFWRKKKK